MLPLKLTVEGFLSFRENTVIDFTKLYKESLYLVTGPTGSGKTSIFDAICYALFKKASGQVRDQAKSMRCHLCGEKDPTLVELEFSHRGREYVVRRLQKTQKGQEKSSLWEKGKETEVIEKGIDAEIQNILGMNYEQFRKIVMLPQGEFRNFLVSAPREKAEILGKLFSTEKYGSVRDIISEKYSILKKETDKRQDSIDEAKAISENAKILASPSEILKVMEEEKEETGKALEETNQNIKENALLLTSLSSEMNKIIEDNQKIIKLNSVREDFEELKKGEAEAEEKKKLAELIASIKPIITIENSFKEAEEALKSDENALKETEEKASLTDRKINDIQNDFDSIEEKNREKDSALKESDRLKAVIEALDEITKLKKSLAEIIENRESSEKELGEVKKSTEKYRKLNDELSENSSLISADESKISELTEKISDLREKESLTETIIIKTGEYKKESDLQKKLEEMISSSESEVADKAEDLKTSEKELHLSGINKFREDLIPGEPCPLCGNLHDPLNEEFIKLSEKEIKITPSQVSQQKESLRQSENILAKLRSDSENSLNRISSLKRECEDLMARGEFSEVPLNEDKNSVTAERRNLEDMRTELKKEVLLKREKLVALKNQKEILSKKISVAEELEKKVSLLKENEIRTQSSIESLEKISEGESDSESLKMRRSELTKTASGITEFIRETEGKFRNYSMEKTRLTERLKNLAVSVEKNKEASKKKKTELDTSLDSIGIEYSDFNSIRKEIPRENSLNHEYREFRDRFTEASQTLKILGDQCKNIEMKDPGETEEKIRQFTEKKGILEDKKSELLIKHSRLSDAAGKIKESAEFLKKNSEDLSILENLLHITSRGTTFENYVLSYFLDGVLIHANRNLLKMTGDRYRLIRNTTEEDKKNRIQGLSLNIFDSYTNGERDVGSLSGGESFKASLALALGLSGYISESRGGSLMEAIFIDEGFGTLDSESIDSAMETLMELGSTGRKVAVISHVEELKERIPSKIKVTNSPSKGSSALIYRGEKKIV